MVIDRKVTEIREEIKEEEREARVTESVVAVEGFVQQILDARIEARPAKAVAEEVVEPPFIQAMARNVDQ